MIPDGPRFSLQGVGRFPVHLDGLVARAEQRGLRSLLIEVLRQVSDNLERNPREWGDPYMNYRGLKAVGYGKLILPARIRVEYAVHNSEPLVWISAIGALIESPFA